MLAVIHVCPCKIVWLHAIVRAKLRIFRKTRLTIITDCATFNDREKKSCLLFLMKCPTKSCPNPKKSRNFALITTTNQIFQ